MVGAATGGVGAAAAHAFDDGFEGHINFQYVVQFDAGSLHGIGLGNGAGETVEEETLGAVGLGNALFDQIDDQLIADQGASLHHGIGLQAQWGTCLDCCAEHIAGRDLRDAVLLADEGGLRALSGARRAQQNQSHGGPQG